MSNLVTFSSTLRRTGGICGAWNTATSAIRKCGVPRKNRADEQHRKNQEAHVRDCGKNDPRVPVSESQQIADALKKQGTPAWLLIAKDEGHGYRKKPNRIFSFKCDGRVLAGVFAE